MTSPMDLPPTGRWAQLRFAIIGPLIHHPLARGELRSRLQALGEQKWTHPITGQPVCFGKSTIERWYYQALASTRPTQALQRSRRKDAGSCPQLAEEVSAWIRVSYQDHPFWTCLLHYDNLLAWLKKQGKENLKPSYASLRRFMKHEGLRRRHWTADLQQTTGAQAARARFEQLEVRSYEHSHTHALWHIDGHRGSVGISHQGTISYPVLIAVLDDHSRLICHAQWFWQEEAAACAHVLKGAIVKRGLPRSLLSDNGGAFTAAEISQGLHRLGILAETTMSYSPYQNGKMEVFWGSVEGRLLAMLRTHKGLDLYQLNKLTLAWIEHDYHRRPHAGITTTPLKRYVDSPQVGRETPGAMELAQAFTRRETRQQRHSDGTICLEGRRFCLPSHYRTLNQVVIRYATWDLDTVYLANPDTDTILERLYPVDRQANADGIRALRLEPESGPPSPPPKDPEAPSVLPPLLQTALDTAKADAFAPSFIPYAPEPRRETAS